MSLGLLVDLDEHGDERGTLVAIEGHKDIPFEVQRVYYMYGTGSGARRGGHAHRDLQQLAIAVSGSCRFLLDDGRSRTELVLDRPNRGLLLDVMLWREMFDFSSDCVLLVLADKPYREANYIRDYGEFLKLVGNAGGPKGADPAPMISPLADVQTTKIGVGTRIWQYVVVLPGAQIGSNCNICAHVFIEDDVTIGNDVTIKNGVSLWNGLRIGNGVFIGPNAAFTNDRHPRSKIRDHELLITRILDGASIGANATILPGLTIGCRAMVGAGAVVVSDVADNQTVVGNPACSISGGSAE
jgi:UDP-2-acetamido-3-amino-2,3-dideoxy-glucuronate N-acetyltransferase